MVNKTPGKRPVCLSCSKPLRLCLCGRFKYPPIDNSIPVTILRHSHEKNHPLNSTRIATLGLKNLNLVTVSDVLFQAHFAIRSLRAIVSGDSALVSKSERISASSSPDKSSVSDMENEITHLDSDQTEVLITAQDDVITATIAKCGFTCTLTRLSTLQNHLEKPNFNHLAACPIGKHIVEDGFTVKKIQRKLPGSNLEHEEMEEFTITVPPGSALLYPSEKSIGLESVDFEVKHLIVLDGTWAKANRMYHENPWLKFLPHLKLDRKETSLYSEVRRQPKSGCLSTIESIVSALKGLGEDSMGLDDILNVFESMVRDQRRCKDERLKKDSLV